MSDFLAWIGAPASIINNITSVPVDGGYGATPGPGQVEVLLDIDDIVDTAPAALIRVYNAPFTTSFQDTFNAMIGDHVDIISNSWAACEDQMSQADVQSIDSVLQTAAAAGITVFNGTGDDGSTCLDGSANTVAVPADSPNATAVGGSSLSLGTGFGYGSETWWDDSSTTPAAGQGGYGVSRYFPRPSYQNVLSSYANRSVPDVVANADPFHGVMICDAALGGCPTGLSYGGTSSAAPTWAAMMALLNQTQGKDLGALNPLIYPYAGSSAFHDAASMGSDFAHVGLGSPNLAELHRMLTGQTAGTVSTSVSEVREFGGHSIASLGTTLIVPADGSSTGYVVALVNDANGNIISGSTVTLTAQNGSAKIAPASALSDSSGTATFQVTDLTTETVTFTVMAGGVTLGTKPAIQFITPPATGAQINASPAAVVADGVSTATITVTLQDALGRPTAGKNINLMQNAGAFSRIANPIPSVTDANGQTVFTVTDTYDETVTYSAVDASDGDLPVPGSAQVIFGSASSIACVPPPPVAADGYLVTPFATAFYAQNINAGGVSIGGCNGALGMAFDAAGNLYVGDVPNGNIYKFGPSGGVAGNSTLFSTAPGPGVSGLAFSADGKHLYAARIGAGDVIDLDPTSGVLVREVGQTSKCAFGLSLDPLSGDLFADDYCYQGVNSNVFRIENPASANPTVAVYATAPAAVNGEIAFAPDGTLYLPSGNANGIVRITGTNGPVTPTVTLIPTPAGVSDLSLVIASTTAGGDAASLIFPSGDANNSASNRLTQLDLATNPVSISAVLATGATLGENAIIGPDGCLYEAWTDTVYKISNVDGTCPLAIAKSAPSLYLTLGTSSTPTQGTSQTFTASSHFGVPAGTPVTFIVAGANPQVSMVRTDSNGNAAFSYTPLHPGTDKVTAEAVINGNEVTSNTSSATWSAGVDTTYLSLNTSPTAGVTGQTVMLAAQLLDASQNPATALASQPVQLAVGSQSCSATTDASGNAICSVALTTLGQSPLTATFAGVSGSYTPSSATKAFDVSAATSAPPPPPPSGGGSGASGGSGGGGAFGLDLLGLFSVLALLRRFWVIQTRRDHSHHGVGG